MKGVHPSVCTHHNYIKEVYKSVRQPQRRMNPALKYIVKEELQKLLDVGFIYPISDSEWVPPLVLVPKKNGRWRIFVNYRELNKATKKDHFPLPFIDQVLDGFAGKKCFRYPGRHKRDALTINVIGQLSDLMLGQVICLKYLGPGSLVVDVHINVTIIPHTLTDLQATITMMTRDIMLKLNL